MLDLNLIKNNPEFVSGFVLTVVSNAIIKIQNSI